MQKVQKKKILILGVTVIVASLALIPARVFVRAQVSGNTTVEELNRTIEQREAERKQLQQKQEEYAAKVAEKQKVAASLHGELELLDAQMQKAEADMQTIDFAVEDKQREITATQLQIESTEKDMQTKRAYLGELVRTIHRYDQKDPLELLVIHNSFSDVVNDLRTTTTMERQVTDTLTDLKGVKVNLERERQDREVRKRELENLEKELLATQTSLNDQKTYKGTLLDETKSSEQQYANLLDQSRQEQLSADSDIRQLQEQVKAKLEPNGQGSDDGLTKFTGNRNVQLAWPVSPAKGISAYFHDPSYPYRKYFEHPAIDVPTPQRTPIAAPDDGYVARAKNAGFGYSYILLVHSNSISTVYGHVSQINVAEDTFVKKGQIIGLSGGMPGTPGAGNMTTGPHLHFEVRLNGIPVNPLDYLP
ncbi:MAG: peptidoglycan DD-metalloendopeptidase family protein [Patescibacteria group bacterium]